MVWLTKIKDLNIDDIKPIGCLIFVLLIIVLLIWYFSILLCLVLIENISGENNSIKREWWFAIRKLSIGVLILIKFNSRPTSQERKWLGW